MPPAFVSTPAEQPIHQLASPLIATCNGQVEFVSGTAFVVGRGYALTAYHVIADFLARYEGVQDPVAQLDVSFELLLFVSLDEGKRTLPMKVLRVWRSAPLDIAVLALGVPEDLPDDYRWKVPRLRLLPPKVGAHISAFGFADSAVSRYQSHEDPVVNLHPRTATGIVEELHHEVRDTSRMPFPCFRTNARFDGGMSGGPVFDNEGHVCGVICSNLPPPQGRGSHTSYVCTLWPIVATPIDAGPNSVATGSYYPLMNLFRSGVLVADDVHHVSIRSESSCTWTPAVRYPGAAWTV